MAWTEICIRVARGETAAAEDALEALGALAVTLEDDADDPVLEPGPGETPLWPSVRVRGLFEAGAGRARIVAGLQGLDAARRPGNLAFRDIGDRDWTRAWMDRFRPMRFGRRLWIVPGGMAIETGAEAIELRLDPGLAFGTGTHPTTALCLEWLDGHACAGRRVLDYGCGSGVLGIAAVLLGAARAACIDNDPQALVATAENARRNGVADRVQGYLPDDCPAAAHDLVLANILAGPLIALAPRLVAAAAPDGVIVLSGLLGEQADDVLAAYRGACRVEDVITREGWARAVLVKN